MSVLAPVLAGSIQTVWVLVHSISSEYYQALFYPHKSIVDLTVAVPIVVGVVALITFFLLWCSVRARPWLCWPVFFTCCALWTYVAFISIARFS